MTGGQVVKIGTRGSRLALWQAEHVGSLLCSHRPGIAPKCVVVKTVGDRITDVPLSRIGDKGLFTKELDAALLSGQIDLAVHSLKDLPTLIPDGLVIGAVLERDDPRDALISAPGLTLAKLPAGSRVGTSSLRRRSQLLALRPDLRILDLRGNVPTRIATLERGPYEAIVLASAGVRRLGLESRITETIGADRLLPAVGQGAIGVVVRSDDPTITELALLLDHRATRLATAAERGLLRRLEGGCQVPIGALAVLTAEHELVLDGLVADLDGLRIVRAQETGHASTPEDAVRIGERLAETLLGMGAREILDRIAQDARTIPRPLPSGGGAGG